MTAKRAESRLSRIFALLLPALCYLLLDHALQAGFRALGLEREPGILLSETLLAGAALCWYLRVRPAEKRAPIAFAAVGASLLLALCFALALTVLPTAREAQPATFTAVLAYAFAAPAAEELVYRGLVLHRGEAAAGRAPALAASVLLFAAGHPGWLPFLSALVFGCLLALLFERWRSLFPPLLVHILVNLLSFVFPRLAVPALFAVLGAAGLIFGFFRLIPYKK